MRLLILELVVCMYSHIAYDVVAVAVSLVFPAYPIARVLFGNKVLMCGLMWLRT